jgi:predicted MFS family arabinose efflux permease
MGPRGAVAAGGLMFALVAWLLAEAQTSAAAIAVFLAFGLVAGLSESSERLLVARLAPVRTGRGFGGYHAVTGLAALPAALFFGAIYQWKGGPVALGISAGAVLVAAGAWLLIAPAGER